MTSAELKQVVTDMEDLHRKDWAYLQCLIGIVSALENIREEMIYNIYLKEKWRVEDV